MPIGEWNHAVDFDRVIENVAMHSRGAGDRGDGVIANAIVSSEAMRNANAIVATGALSS